MRIEHVEMINKDTFIIFIISLLGISLLFVLVKEYVYWPQNFTEGLRKIKFHS